MNKIERQSRILQLIEQSSGKQLLETRQLAEALGVSEMTVRRDLQKLSQEGLLLRQHGGAGPAHRYNEQPRKEIGVLQVGRTGKYSDPFFNALLEGVDQKLQTLGYRIAYVNTRAEINTRAHIQALFRTSPVDGIILLGPTLETEVLNFLKANMRVLVSTTSLIGPQYDTITFDGYGGIHQVIDYLVGNNYRRLGFISGQYDTRQQGFLDGVHAHKLPYDPRMCAIVPFGIDGWTPQLGLIGVEQLMQLPEPPEAIVCASDLIAIGAIQWLHQHKLRVPEDIAVTGFDDIAESAFTVPPLTTVHVHKQLIGALAAERVVKRIENDDEVPLLIQTPTILIARHSVVLPNLQVEITGRES